MEGDTVTASNSNSSSNSDSNNGSGASTNGKIFKLLGAIKVDVGVIKEQMIHKVDEAAMLKELEAQKKELRREHREDCPFKNDNSGLHQLPLPVTAPAQPVQPTHRSTMDKTRDTGSVRIDIAGLPQMVKWVIGVGIPTGTMLLGYFADKLGF